MTNIAPQRDRHYDMTVQCARIMRIEISAWHSMYLSAIHTHLLDCSNRILFTEYLLVRLVQPQSPRP